MSSDPVIQCFQDEFERFFNLMEKQVEVCPEAVWANKGGGWRFWQQVYHTLVCLEFYAVPNKEVSGQHAFSRDVGMLLSDSEDPMSKDEVLEFGKQMHTLAVTYFDSLTSADLTAPHASLTRLIGAPRTHQHALIAMSRHCCYHLGCLDSVLRDNGVKGVY